MQEKWLYSSVCIKQRPQWLHTKNVFEGKGTSYIGFWLGIMHYLRNNKIGFHVCGAMWEILADFKVYDFNLGENIGDLDFTK